MAVAEVEFPAQRELHDRYRINAAPLTLVADAQGVVRKSLVGAFSAPYAIAVDAASFVGSALLMTAIKRVEELPAALAGSRRRMRAEIGEGLGYVFRHPLMRPMMFWVATANFFGTLAVLKSQGYRVLLAILTDGIAGLTHTNGTNRVREAEAASDVRSFELPARCIARCDPKYSSRLIMQIEQWVMIMIRPESTISSENGVSTGFGAQPDRSYSERDPQLSI